MLDYIRSFILTPDSPRSVVSWIRYVKFLERSADMLKQRHFASNPIETKGMVLLRRILANLDMLYLQRKGLGDLDKYMNYLRFVQSDLDRQFSTVPAGVTYTNALISKKTLTTDEYYLAVDCVDYIRTLPWDKPWEEWKKLRAVRLWDHDSPEFTLNLINDSVAFAKKQPHYAFFTVDVVILAFQYMKFLEEEEGDNKTQQMFIHRYVINQLHDDLIDVWLLQQLEKSLTITDDAQIRDIDYNDIVVDGRYGWVGTQYREGLLALHQLKEQLDSAGLKPSSYMSTPLLTNETSLFDRLLVLYEQLDMETLYQYKGMIYLRDRRLLKLIWELYKRRPDFPTTETLSRRLKQIVFKYRTAKVWNGIPNQTLRAEVMFELDRMWQQLR